MRRRCHSLYGGQAPRAKPPAFRRSLEAHSPHGRKGKAPLPRRFPRSVRPRHLRHQALPRMARSESRRVCPHSQKNTISVLRLVEPSACEIPPYKYSGLGDRRNRLLVGRSTLLEHWKIVACYHLFFEQELGVPVEVGAPFCQDRARFVKSLGNDVADAEVNLPLRCCRSERFVKHLPGKEGMRRGLVGALA